MTLVSLYLVLEVFHANKDNNYIAFLSVLWTTNLTKKPDFITRLNSAVFLHYCQKKLHILEVLLIGGIFSNRVIFTFQQTVALVYQYLNFDV